MLGGGLDLQRVQLICQRLSDALVERPFFPRDDRARHAVADGGGLAGGPDAPGEGRPTRPRRAIRAGRVELLIQRQQVGEEIVQHAEEVLALLVREGQPRAEQEAAAVIGRPARQGLQVGVIVAQAGQQRHGHRAGGDAGGGDLLHGLEAPGGGRGQPLHAADAGVFGRIGRGDDAEGHRGAGALVDGLEQIQVAQQQRRAAQHEDRES